MMACAIWKARNEMNPLGQIFRNKLSTKHTRSSNCDNLCQTVPGHPEVAANKLVQTWNLMNLSSANTLVSARSLARKWYKNNVQFLLRKN